MHSRIFGVRDSSVGHMLVSHHHRQQLTRGACEEDNVSTEVLIQMD